MLACVPWAREAYPQAGCDVHALHCVYWWQQSLLSHAQPDLEHRSSTDPDAVPSLQRRDKTHHPAEHTIVERLGNEGTPGCPSKAACNSA